MSKAFFSDYKTIEMRIKLLLIQYIYFYFYNKRIEGIGYKPARVIQRLHSMSTRWKPQGERGLCGRISQSRKGVFHQP